MWRLQAGLAALQLAGAVAAEPADGAFYQWLQPRAAQLEGSLHWGLEARQQRGDYNPGYNPEFGSCGSGKTCSDACGTEFEACNATTGLSLFCFNPGAGQKCCPNGSGRESPSLADPLFRGN